MFKNPFQKLDMDRKKRSSNLFRQMQDSSKCINDRVKITIIIVSALFLVIVCRLVYLQLLNQESYSIKLENYTAKKQSFSSPRGTIYDRNGKVLVESISSLTISYYPISNISDKEEWDLAEKVVSELHLSATSITERQLKDLHILYKKSYDKKDPNSLSVLSKEQMKKLENGNIKDDDLYQWKIEATDVSGLDDHTKAVYQTKMKMDASPENQYKVVVEDATKEQISYLSENSESFPGFKSTFDWKRNYSETGESLKSILGSVSTQTQGVPSEQSDFYLALGYELNDRVGTSGLEKQYEKFLSGSKSIYNIKFDENGVAFLEQAQAGKSGYDLTLTINTDYQAKMDQMLMDTLNREASSSPFMNDLYLVVMNSNSGEIISMSNASRDKSTGEVYSDPTGTYLKANRVGSIVKPATLYMGQNEKVVSPGEVIVDAPMSLKGTPIFKSYTNKGAINDIEAIRQSSNVYMAHIAIRLGGDTYVAGKGLSIKENTFELMRNYYNMFGLGVKTGIDLPNEQVGYIGPDTEAGKILHYSIGQYDSYTTMQVAQYVSTLANGGKRIQPHLLSKVSEVNDPSTLIYKFNKNILSTIFGDTSLLERSKEGMILCANTSCSLPASKSGVQLASKSGTAQDEITVNGVSQEMANSSMIAFGPAENPEVSFACVAPYANNTSSNICSEIIGNASKEYFSNK